MILTLVGVSNVAVVAGGTSHILLEIGDILLAEDGAFLTME